MPKAQQFKYFFDEAEAKENNKKMVRAEKTDEKAEDSKEDDKKDEKTEDKTDDKKEDDKETKDKKIVMPSGGETEADNKPKEELSEDEERQQKMAEAGFPVD